MAYQRFVGTADLSEINVRTKASGKDYPKLVAGLYPVVVLDAGLDVREGETPETARSVTFAVEVTSGEFAGARAWISTGTDLSRKGNQIFFKTALVSMGYDADSLGGNIQIDTAEYVGKAAFMRFVPRDENSTDPKTKYDVREFVTEAYYADWLSKKQGMEAGSAISHAPTFKAQAATAGTVAAPKPAGVPQPSGNAAKYANLMNK